MPFVCVVYSKNSLGNKDAYSTEDIMVIKLSYGRDQGCLFICLPYGKGLFTNTKK